MSTNADTIRDALPYAAGDHHGRCAFAAGEGRECDCYAKSSFAAHGALDALLAEVEQLRAALERACFIAEHLMDMTDQEAWRETGAIGPEGQYEGDFRQSLIWDEIQQLRAVRG